MARGGSRHQLRRQPFAYRVNRKRIQRLMRQMHLLRPVKRRKVRTTNSQHPYVRYPNLVKDLEITHPDQVWVSDITYVRLHDEFVYLAIILDVFTRAIRGWCLSRAIDLQLTLDALHMALEQHGPPQIHHSDQGLQYAAHAYVDLLHAHAVQISMAAVGKAEENGFAERFMRTIKEEEVDLSEYHDFADAQSQIGHFIQAVYNHKRIHSALRLFHSVRVRARLAARSNSDGLSPPPKDGQKSVQLYGSTTHSACLPTISPGHDNNRCRISLALAACIVIFADS